MSDGTHISWTGATWNPSTGCDRVSPGCDNCYALTLAGRLKAMGSAKYQRDGNPGTSGPGFGLTVHPDALTIPLRWHKPRRIFVDSMSDLFHDMVPDEFIAQVFAVMAATPQHIYQVLSKRHARLRALLNQEVFRQRVMGAATDLGHLPYPRHMDGGGLAQIDWPLPNVHVGVSVESQQWADIRIPALLDTPAAVRWLSVEPMLGPVDLSAWLGPVDWPPCWDDHEPSAECARCIQPEWVVTGGESGPDHRPMELGWLESLVDQCNAADVPVFVKQDSGPRAGQQGRIPDRLWAYKQYPEVSDER